MENEWMAALKPGDKVIVCSQGFGKPVYHVHTVERVTPTQIVIRHWRFRKSTGGEIGASGFRSSHIQRATPERIAEVEANARHRALIGKMRETKWEELSAEVLASIAAILEAKRPAGEE